MGSQLDSDRTKRRSYNATFSLSEIKNRLAEKEPIIKNTWYVVFTTQDVKVHWFHRLMHKQFLHCYCFRAIDGVEQDLIYWANPTTANIDTKIFEGMHASLLAHSLKFVPNTKVLTFKTSLDFSNKILTIWNMVPTCVSVVKMFLGIRARAQTPYQLYKHLLKIGATHDSFINFGK